MLLLDLKRQLVKNCHLVTNFYATKIPYTRVANYRYNFFIAIIGKVFKIIAILSVIGENFG